MLILLGGAAFVLLLSLYATERLLVQPRPPVRPSPAGCDIVYEDVSFTTRDGVGLRGWFFASVGRPVIIYCPGRGEGLNAFDFRYAPLFYHGGYQVLMFDWRGMGASGGQSSMAYWEKLDLQAAVRYVRERGISGTIGAMGTSLGAAVIFLAAGEIPDLAAVAGESAFATYEGMIASGLHALYAIPSRITRILAWVIARFAAWRGRFPLHDADPVRAIGRISPRPVFVIHGKNDRHVPVQAGLALYEAAGEPKTIWLPDVAHTEGLQILGPEYASRLLAFFDRWLK
jgi:alpha-beta hydrolase superfamily lysophospholipase